jgi:hypothetical protein
MKRTLRFALISLLLPELHNLITADHKRQILMPHLGAITFSDLAGRLPQFLSVACRSYLCAAPG